VAAPARGQHDSLGELHEILQNAFGWSGEHLHRFLIHGVTYGIPHVDGIVFREDARGVPLSRFRLHCGERFRYEYDFTADWKFDIRLEGALRFDPKRALPSCIGGRRAVPPEDCAAAWDYLKRMDWHRSHLPIDEVIVLAAGTLCIPRSSSRRFSLRPPQAGCLSRKLKICALHLGPNLIGDEIVDAGSFALNPRTTKP